MRKSDHIKVLEKSTECIKKILEAKRNYILKMTTKLEHSNAAPKTYWAILNRLLYNKKVPAIPPLFFDGSFISGYCKKAILFNNFFVSICTPIKNNSVSPPLLYKTNTRINSFHVTKKDILSIIKSLDSSKSHGVIIPEVWKNVNVVPVHKKEGKTLIKNYRPISLLPIFGKMFERVIHNSLFNYFLSNKLFTSSQPGLLPGDSQVLTSYYQ